MKTSLSFNLASRSGLAVCASALIAGVAATSIPTAAQAQTTGYSDIVGFITLQIAGTGGAPSSAISFRGLSLTRPVEYQGDAETLSGTTVTDTDATWTDNQFNGTGNACYLELIYTGAAPVPAWAGTIYDITATNATTKTLTLAQTLAAGVPADSSFKIRKHWTIGSVFGPANEGGLFAGSASTADQILIWNGSTYQSYYRSTGGIVGAGWRLVNSVPGNADQVNAVILPDDAVIVKRTQQAAINVVLMGAVKTGQTSFAVLNGTNVLPNPFAAPVTFGGSGLLSSGFTGGSASTSDQVLIWNGTSYDTFYYSTGGIVGAGWRKVNSVPGNQDQANSTIPVGSSIVLKRFGTAFEWKIPQHPASL